MGFGIEKYAMRRIKYVKWDTVEPTELANQEP